MGKSSTAIAVYLLIYYGIIDAFPADVHIPTPSEVVDRERDSERSQQDRSRDARTMDDPNASEKEKQDALDRMIENYEIC